MDAELIKTVQDLIGFVKNVSPHVWELLIRQQYIIGILTTSVLAFFGICLIFSTWILVKKPKWALDKHGDCDIFDAVVPVLCVIVGVCLLPFLIKGLPRLLNPEYYALMALKP